MNIRQERTTEHYAVENLTREAFWTRFWDKGEKMTDVHLLVNRLRNSPALVPELNLVAEICGELVGHIIYTVSKINSPTGESYDMLTFGPLSVHPLHQSKGIDAALMRHSFKIARELGYKAVLIFGHPDYYPRVGFRRAAEFGITAADGATFDAHMVYPLYEGALDGITGSFHIDPVYESLTQEDAFEFDKKFPEKSPYIPPAIDVLLDRLEPAARETIAALDYPYLATTTSKSEREFSQLVDAKAIETIRTVTREHGQPWGRSITVNRGHNPVYEAILDDLVQDVFGFSFEPWFEYELWDERYESYSIIECGKMLSNVNIYKFELVVDGKKVSAIRFGAVATRKSERGKGHSRRLMEHVLSLYPDTLAYLSANESVVDFYPLFGFSQLQTYKPEISYEINNSNTTAVNCDIDDEIVEQAIQNRSMYSNMVDCLNSQPIQYFHLIMEYLENIYHLPGCDVIALATKTDDKLFVADIIAAHPVTFDEIARELPFDGIRTVEFGFCPDWLGISPVWKPACMAGDPFFVKGEWQLPEMFRFPQTSET